MSEHDTEDRSRFNKALARINLMLLPVFLMIGLAVPVLISARQFAPAGSVGPLRFVDIAGIGTRHPGVGVGVIAVGGLALGAVAIGGGALGIVALGGGAVGVVALGGGSIGLIAVGGGAVGYIAVGGGAVGYYQKAAGKYVLALNRQDDEAIEFFCRYFPSLRAAVTRPMPVLPASAAAPPSAPAAGSQGAA